ncbi:MAG: hypothetical protein WC862_05255 [Patescibacteria group bacterium]
MFSPKTLTLLLAIAIVALSFQTIVLIKMSQKLANAEIGIGNSPSAVNLTDDGSTPSMVGGC